jgi:predicted TPR repeat methyltransferase
MPGTGAILHGVAANGKGTFITGGVREMDDHGMDESFDFMNLPGIPPAAFFSGLNASLEGMERFAAVSSACELFLFDHLEAGTGDPATLSALTGANPEALECLLSVLADAGLVTRSGRGFSNRPVASTYLVSTSPFAQLHHVRKNAVFMQEIWAVLRDRLVEGPLAFEQESFFRELSLPAMADNALCGRLQRTVREVTALPGFSDCRKMVDLGGGHGLYSIALTAVSPQLEAVVFDLPSVIPLAESYISRFHAGRVRTMPGDFFSQSFGTGYDLVFSSSNPSGKSTGLVPVIAGALVPGGYFVNVQSDGQDEKDVYQALEWQLWTIGKKKKGNGAYTREQPFLTGEYREALRDAGLEVIRETDVCDDYREDTFVHLMVAQKKVPDSSGR